MKNQRLLNAIGRIDDELVYGAAQKDAGSKRRFSMKRIIVLIAAVMTVFILSVPALAVANVEPAYEILYLLSPEIAQKLKPVRMSCEDKNIKFEVISASIEGDEAQIYVSVQDLSGDRIDSTTDLFDSYSINTPFDCDSTCKNIGFDEETKTATFLITVTQWNGQSIVGDKITFRARKLLSNKQEFDAALSGLDMSGSSLAPETVVPTHIFGGGGKSFNKYKDDFRALASSGVLCSPVEGVDITAMGYVDGELRVQVRYENILETDNHGYIYLKNTGGDVVSSIAGIAFATDSEHQERYYEYIFDLTGVELSEYTFYGYFMTSDTLIKGNWSVTFPVASSN